MTGMTRVIGMTVLPEWAQVEGVEAVLDTLQSRAGVNAIATSPYVMAPSDDPSAGREPPVDAGAGKVRLLDRLLWGQREISCRTAPSFEPDLWRYSGLRYQPSPPDDLTHREGRTVARFVSAAKGRGIAVWLQVQAAIPPGYRVQFGAVAEDDEPLLPEGVPARGRLDKNGSLASPHIRAYLKALLADLANAYPEIDGFRIDWPEYPPYTLDSVFLDFSGHALQFARVAGYDADRMRADTLAVRQRLLGGLTDADLKIAAVPEWLGRYPGLADLFALKADLVIDFLADLRGAMPKGKKLVPQAFPPPWHLASGFDYARASAHCDAIGVKQYTMHWPMMLRFYADALAAANPGLDGGRLARFLVALTGTGDAAPHGIGDLTYPEPEAAHPAGSAAIARKITEARRQASVPVYGFAHGYGPIADVERRLSAAWDASPDGLWVNRYGYMSNDKLDRLGAISRH
ncbi:MAG: hypothetical protein ACO1OK_01795 [Devosia sp.]